MEVKTERLARARIAALELERFALITSHEAAISGNREDIERAEIIKRLAVGIRRKLVPEKPRKIQEVGT